MKEIKFIDVGEGITEGHIAKWLVKDGERVKEDQSIVQVETDKAVVNVPAPIDGVVKIVAQENSTVHVGDMVAYVGEPDELASAVTGAGSSQQSAAQKTPPPPPPLASAQAPSHAQSAQPAPQPKQTVSAPNADARLRHGSILAAPSVRKLARERGIDLASITGSGPHGRILESDLTGSGNATPQNHAAASPEVAVQGAIERVPMSAVRKVIAKNMEASWTIPRAVHMDIMNATALYDIVSREKPRVLADLDVKLTFLPFIIKAVIRALEENPHFNASYDRDKQEILVKKYYNIGLAAGSDDGLRVIVIKEADKKSIIDIAKEIRDLSDKIKNKTITPQEMSGSTFTITNIGSLGGGFLSVPMINYPDVAILGVHLIRDRPMVYEGQIKIGKELPISLTFDHRVVDGADAVRFGNAIIKYLEDPDFLEMLG